MNSRFLFAAVVLLLIAVFGTASAEVGLKFDGQLRFRSEVDNRSFDDDATARQYNLLRTRVMVKAEIEENSYAVIQFQDSRTLGGTTYDGSRASGLLNDGKNVDLHQAYIKIKHLWNDGPGITAGRFEFNLGGQRVFGAVGWHNVGRSWEGIQLNCSKTNFSLFYLKAIEKDAFDYNADFDIFGLTTHIKKLKTDFFGFYEFNANQPDTFLVVNSIRTNFINTFKTLKRFNFGAYGKWNYEAFDFEANFVYQTGTQLAWTEPVTDSLVSAEYDIAAMMFTFEAGYNFDMESKLRLAAGIDYSSGDDTADDEIKHYTNAYYTGHKFRGYMDYFIASETYGLVDMMIRAKLEPFAGWTFNGDLHLFQSAVDMAGDSKSIGTEFDLTATTNNIKGAAFNIGASIFMPSDDYMPDADMTYWLFTQLTVNFK